MADVVGYTSDYDELNRLKTADLAKASWSSVNNYDVGVSTPLEYDPNGNLLKLLRKNNSGSGSTMTYSYGIDGSNWLTEVNGNGLSRDYVYDPNGNMTADGDYVTDVDYDIFNMPIEVTTTQATAYNRYDVHNRRVYRRLASVDTTFYVRGADGTTLAVYDGSGDLMYRRILGAGEIIGRSLEDTAKGASSTDRQYYVKDHLGSIRGTINESGSPDHQSDYYPFGLEMPGRVLTLDAPRERYTGHEIETLGTNTTWYYAGARMYDPVVARWMTTDPLAEKFPGWSPYNYVGGNPISLFDPDGMAPMGADCCRLSNVLRRTFSWVRPTIREARRKAAAFAEQQRDVAIDVVKEGPRVLDAVALGASGTAILAGTGAIVSANPIHGTAATVAAATALGATMSGAILARIDAEFLGGDVREATIRERSLGIGFATSVVGAGIVSSTLNRALLPAHQVQATSRAVGVATGATARQIVNETQEEEKEESEN